MTVPVAGGAALVIILVLVVAGGWRLVILDRDLARLDDELLRLQDELRRTQQQLQARDERQRETAMLTRQIQHYLEWADPWLRYLVAVSQEHGQ